MVAKKGEIMAKVSGGGMAAVIALDAEKIQDTLASNDLTRVDLANFNSPGQIVLSGPASEVDSAIPLLKDAGAKLVVPLKVSGAFHSQMMKEPSLNLQSLLGDFPFPHPLFRFIRAFMPSLTKNSREIAEKLVLRMRRPVRWTEIITNLRPVPEFRSLWNVDQEALLTKLLRQIP